MVMDGVRVIFRVELENIMMFYSKTSLSIRIFQDFETDTTTKRECANRMPHLRNLSIHKEVSKTKTHFSFSCLKAWRPCQVPNLFYLNCPRHSTTETRRTTTPSSSPRHMRPRRRQPPRNTTNTRPRMLLHYPLHPLHPRQSHAINDSVQFTLNPLRARVNSMHPAPQVRQLRVPPRILDLLVDDHEIVLHGAAGAADARVDVVADGGEVGAHAGVDLAQHWCCGDGGSARSSRGDDGGGERLEDEVGAG